MIQVTFMEVERGLTSALQKIGNEKLPLKVSWNIQRIIRKLDKEIELARNLYQQILKEHCELDEKGQLVPRKAKGKDGIEIAIPGSFSIIPEKEEAFKKASEEYFDLKMTIESNPIKLSELSSLQISPNDLAALFPLIEEDCEMPKKTAFPEVAAAAEEVVLPMPAKKKPVSKKVKG